MIREQSTVSFDKLRETVISEWTGLREKINNLKLSDKDKEVIDYFSNSCLINFIPSLINTEDELAKWEKEVQVFYERAANLCPDNDWIIEYLLFVSALVATISSWIQQRKLISTSQSQLNEIHAYLIRSDVVDMYQIISYDEIMRELKRVDNFWNKISNWDKSLKASENNPNAKFFIYEDFD